MTNIPFAPPLLPVSVLVGNHFIRQLLLKASHGLACSSGDQVCGSILHLVNGHVTGLSYLPLGKVHKLGIPGIEA